jgi:hypothetical protein
VRRTCPSSPQQELAVLQKPPWCMRSPGTAAREVHDAALCGNAHITLIRHVQHFVLYNLLFRRNFMH